MHAWTLAAVGCLVAGASALFIGEQALADARDLVALYWLVAGAVSLRASIALAEW
jgi:ABC-type uncharacterized transport system permease subunit